MCHMLTKEEARERFLKEVWNIVWYWEVARSRAGVD